MVDVLKVVIQGDDDFSKTFKNFRASMDVNVAKAALAGAAALGAYGAATYASVKATAEAYDQVGKFAGRIGISTEALSAYNHVAELSGISSQTLNMGFQRMTRRIAEASQGMGVAKNALSELGIPIKDIAKLAPDKQFEMIAKSMDGLANQSDKVRLAMQFFDSEGVALIQTLSNGSAGLEEMKAEAEKFGLVISQKAAANAAGFNDSLTRVMGSVKGLRNAFAEDLMPMITGLQNRFADFVANNRKDILEFVKTFTENMLWIAEKGAYAVGILVDAWRGLKMIFQVLKIHYTNMFNLFMQGTDLLLQKVIQLMQALNFKGALDGAIAMAESFKTVSEDIIWSLEKTGNAARDSLKNIVDEGFAVEKVALYTDKIKEVIGEIEKQGEAAVVVSNQLTDVVKENIDIQLSGWELINEKVQEYIENIPTWAEASAELITQTFDMLSKGIGDSVASAIIDGESLADGLQDVMKSVSKSIISALISVGIQRFIIAKIFGAASTQENVMRMGQLTQQTFASAFASTAAIPVIGPIIAPGVAAGATATMLAASTAAKGAGMVAGARQDGGAVFGGNSYLVGEAGAELFVPRQSGEIVPNNALGGGGGNISVEILPNATNIEAMLQMGKDAWQEITEDKIIPALRNLSQAGITV